MPTTFSFDADILFINFIMSLHSIFDNFSSDSLTTLFRSTVVADVAILFGLAGMTTKCHA